MVACTNRRWRGMVELGCILEVKSARLADEGGKAGGNGKN